MRKKINLPKPEKLPEIQEGVPIPPRTVKVERKSQWDVYGIRRLKVGQSIVLELEVTEAIKNSLTSYLGNLRTRSNLLHDFTWREVDKGIGIWCIKYVKPKKIRRKKG